MMQLNALANGCENSLRLRFKAHLNLRIKHVVQSAKDAETPEDAEPLEI